MKKLFAIVLAVLMLAGVFCGCGGNSDGGKTKLIWALPNAQQADHEMVMKEVNKQLDKLMPGTSLEFKLDTSMSNKWALWMAGETQVDIALSGYYIDLASEISRKSYRPLTDLINKYAPTIKQEMKDYEFQYLSGMVGGELYAIPNLQIYINDTDVFNIQEDKLDLFDYKAVQEIAFKNPTAVKEFYPYIDSFLDKMYAATTDETHARMIYNIKNFYEIFVKRGYEFVGGSPIACYNLDKSVKEGKVTIVNFYETEEYKTFISYAAKWFKKGYISKDVLTGDVGNTSEKPYLISVAHQNFRGVDANNDLILTNAEKKAAEIKADGTCGIGITSAEQHYLGACTLGSLMSYTSIPLTAKNPEKSMQLIELLRTEKGRDLFNTIVYGIKDTHYEETGEYTIKAFDYATQASSSSKYGMINWQMGNMFNMKVIYPYTANTRKYAEQYYLVDQKNFKKTPVYGLAFDNDGHKNTIASIISTNDEFYLQMIGGTSKDKYMKTYNDMLAKLEAAGASKLIANYQKQADAYKK